jgi:hypothetical protein
VVFKSLALVRRRGSSWLLHSTKVEQVALTVAGQWRNFTAFPSILTIAVMSCAAHLLSGSDVINPISMISSFIA